MSTLRLHLDADASNRRLHKALLNIGHDVSRTPNDWMLRDATDRSQLLGATAQGRCIFTFNIRDFMVLAHEYSNHSGIILAAQSRRRFSQLVAALDRMLSQSSAEHMTGTVHWLNEWQK